MTSETLTANNTSKQISAFVPPCLCCINETYMLDTRLLTWKRDTLLLLLLLLLVNMGPYGFGANEKAPWVCVMACR